MSSNSNRGRFIVPAGTGVAVNVAAGQTMTLATVTGGQAADFFAFDANDLSDWLSPMHTWTWTRQMAPFAGQVFLSRRRRPMLRFVSDTGGGRHDMLFAACDQERYEQLGFSGYHRSCSENLINAIASHLGHPIDVVPQAGELLHAHRSRQTPSPAQSRKSNDTWRPCRVGSVDRSR